MRKKLFSAVLSMLSAIMLISALAVPAAAESIADTAKTIKSGKSYSATLGNGEYVDYKVTVSKSGNLNISVNSKMYCTAIYLYDSDGNKVNVLEVSSKSGGLSPASQNLCPVMLIWNDKTEKYNGTVTFSVKKGTYYIRCERSTEYYHTDASGKISIKAEFPEDSTNEKNNAKIDCLTFTMKKGDTAQFGALLSGTTDETVKWTSSDKNVAAVSSDGRITAKSAGTAYITAKLGDSSIKIKIKVS